MMEFDLVLLLNTLMKAEIQNIRPAIGRKLENRQ
jgi:hypothetical protein